jgi:23S rRNA pseudouridine1911/1915/1917 synthase
MSRGLDILFEDEHCLAVSKPAGQFTQGSWAPPGERTLEQAVRHYLDPSDPASAYVGIVHRLDRPVSGVLIWAKNPRAARRLATQFEKRQAAKEYWAIVDIVGGLEAGPAEPSPDGNPCEIAGTWSDWLLPPGVPGVARIVAEGNSGALRAVTRFSREDSRGLPPGCLRYRLWPETGRTHQLRVQSASRGLPIVGDATYGSTRPFPRGIALHARLLRVRHPILQTPLTLTAPLPSEWGDLGD